MLEFLSGNIFESGSWVFVNPVNCVGVSGAGLAFTFKERFPDNYTAYKEHCLLGLLKPGEVFSHRCNGGIVVINAATKLHWRNPSKVDWVRSAVANVLEVAESEDCATCAVPALGCGLGGLEFDRDLYDPMRDSRVLFKVYLPMGASK